MTFLYFFNLAATIFIPILPLILVIFIVPFAYGAAPEIEEVAAVFSAAPFLELGQIVEHGALLGLKDKRAALWQSLLKGCKHREHGICPPGQVGEGRAEENDPFTWSGLPAFGPAVSIESADNGTVGNAEEP